MCERKLTGSTLGSCPDAFVHVDNAIPFHSDVHQPRVVGLNAMLQQLAQGKDAAQEINIIGNKSASDKSLFPI